MLRGESFRGDLKHMSAGLLVINAGSSSIKFSVFDAARDASIPLNPSQRGAVSELHAYPRFHVWDARNTTIVDEPVDAIDHAAAMRHILNWLRAQVRIDIRAVGHRVVHGGDRYAQPVKITPQVIDDLRALVPLAPLHQPHSLFAIEALARTDTDLLQIACFDTAFHQTQPDVARRFGLPRALHDAGIKRYGFHGLSYEYIAHVLPSHLGDRAYGRVIVAHLGNGASLCAMRQGCSVATTMGFTPLDGLVMGTRSGTLDPGVASYLLRTRNMDAAQLEHMLYHESGLLGVSGISGDMQTLLESPAAAAHEAVELFVYRVAREIGSLAAALGGVDAVVFTGGIGEHAAAIRERICRDGAWLGLRLDTQHNQANSACISTPQSAVSVWVIPTHEDEVIARHTLHALEAI